MRPACEQETDLHATLCVRPNARLFASRIATDIALRVKAVRLEAEVILVASFAWPVKHHASLPSSPGRGANRARSLIVETYHPGSSSEGTNVNLSLLACL